jgi:DNA-directed RNA polymerase beta subunit
MASIVNINDKIKKAEERIEYQEEILGKGLNQPFNNTNSGSRKMMYNVHFDHRIPVKGQEAPLVGTGMEWQFGEYSSAFIRAEHDSLVIAKIPKYSRQPEHHYWLIVLDEITGIMDIIEKIDYLHVTESNGYEYDTSYISQLEVGDTIYENDVIRKTNSCDDYNNRMDGVNLLTGYIGMDDNTEDSIIISDEAQEKLTTQLIRKLTFIENDNDIPLNIHGDNDIYKIIPDINEEIDDGIVCSLRREDKAESLFSQAYNRLSDIMMSDEKFISKGKVVDIDIYCNNPEKLRTSFYNAQLRYYYDENIRFCCEIIAAVEQRLHLGYTMTYELEKMYILAKRIINGDQYKKERLFSNIIIDIYIIEENIIDVGDKLSNRYGGKGVISKVLPKHLMPKLDNGKYLEVIFSPSTCVNRENPGQLFEISLTHIGSRILDFMRTNTLSVCEYLDMYYKYTAMISKAQADYVLDTLSPLEDEDTIGFVGSLLERDGIMLSTMPISESMTIDKLSELYNEFTWATQYWLEVPMEDSNGNIRYIQSRRPIVAGKTYIYRLKQIAEDKYSGTSLSATNIINENSRSKASKLYKSPFNRTPIRFGEMESGDLAHIGMEYVIMNLMLYSASPQGRRLSEELLTGDPFHIDISLDESSTNRGVEKFNTYLKTMGLRLVFEKRYKNLIKPIKKFPITKFPITKLKKVIYKVGDEEQFKQDLNEALLEKGQELRKVITKMDNEEALRTVISKF